MAYSLVNRYVKRSAQLTFEFENWPTCFFSFRATFHTVRRWVGEAREGAGPTSPSLILIGCKLDLVEVTKKGIFLFMFFFLQIGVRREVGKEEGQALADLLGALFIETSAKQVASVYIVKI